MNILKHLKDKTLPPLGKIPSPLLDFAANVSGFRSRFQKISSIERVLTAIRHKESDRVPVATLVCAGGRQVSGISFPEYATDAEKGAQAFFDGLEFTGGDVIVLLLDLSVEASDMGQKLEYPENSTPRPDFNNHIIKDISDYKRIKTINIKDAPRMSEYIRLCQNVIKKVGYRSIVSGFIFGPLGVLAMMRGAENMFKDCLLYPNEVKKACEVITEVLVDFTDAQCKTGVSAIAIDTLFASRNGLSKKLWEEIEGPFSREISRKIKEHGLLAGIHNCGHDIYFDAQIKFMEPEFISFAHLPDDCATPKEMKDRYGKYITLVGYVPTPLLVHGTPKQVMEECRRQIDDLAPGGGYILAPGCEYPPNIPLTNAIALVNAAEKYSKKRSH
jgi:uroporphyrinogen decarboxylase